MKKQKKDKKVLMTGGHAGTTALACVEEIMRRVVEGEGWHVVWVGAKTALEGKKIPTIESEIFAKYANSRISQKQIISGRLQRKFTPWTIPSLLKIPLGFIHALFIVMKVRPDVVLSFGGFASYPIVVVSRILGIPVVIHEQTSVAGRSNIASSKFAKYIALSRPSSLEFFDEKKCVVLGNPLMTQISDIKPKTKIGRPPTLFITLGSRSARNVNSVIKQALRELTDSYKVIHITGFEDYDDLNSQRDKLPKKNKSRYEIYKRIDPMQIDGVYDRADIVLARAGANTTSELLSTLRPSVLVPLPISYLKEQHANAGYANDFGIARVLLQENLTKENLLRELQLVEKNWSDMIMKSSKKTNPDLGASQKLVDLVERVMNEK